MLASFDNGVPGCHTQAPAVRGWTRVPSRHVVIERFPYFKILLVQRRYAGPESSSPAVINRDMM